MSVLFLFYNEMHVQLISDFNFITNFVQFPFLYFLSEGMKMEHWAKLD